MKISEAVSSTTNAAAKGWRGGVDHLFYLIGTLPTTNMRIIVTLYIAVRTSEHYMRNPSWVPSIEWLGFILALAGVDVAQWTLKRKTTFTNGQTVDAPSAVTPPTSSLDASQQPAAQ